MQEQYGNKIFYQVTPRGIVLQVHQSIAKNVFHIFQNNYNLPIEDRGTGTNQGFFEFMLPNVDEYTFLRHLKTAEPEQYEGL